jgi:hypothetical protein
MPKIPQPLRELPTLAIGGPLFAALAVCAMVVRPLAYFARHSMICQWIRGGVIAKSAGSGEPVFSSMDDLLYGPKLSDGRFLKEKWIRDH